MKRKATADAQEPPAGMLRTQLSGVHARVISQLPERKNLKKTRRRQRRRYLPPNPTSLVELNEIPDEFTKTVTGDKFLIYDLNDHDEPKESRVIVFATRRNLEMLAASSMWFLNGTVKVSFN